jgi:hypothetical protein
MANAGKDTNGSQVSKLFAFYPSHQLPIHHKLMCAVLLSITVLPLHGRNSMARWEACSIWKSCIGNGRGRRHRTSRE